MSAISLHLSAINGRVYATIAGGQVDVTDVSVAELTRRIGADLCGCGIAPPPVQDPVSVAWEPHTRPKDISTCPQFVGGAADSVGDDWCGTCYRLCGSSAWGVVKACGHHFHDSCLQTHLQTSGEALCPLCNADLEQPCKRTRVGL
jgi:hypothetical protein